MPIPLCLLYTHPSAAVRLTALEWCIYCIFVLFSSFLFYRLRCNLCACLCKGSDDLSMSCLQSPGCLWSAVLLFIACLRQLLTKYLHTLTSAALCMRETSSKQPHPFCLFLRSLPKNLIPCCAFEPSQQSCNLSPNT